MSLKDRAVDLLRKGNSYLETINALDEDSLCDFIEIRDAVYEAQKSIREADKAAMDCAVAAFTAGESFHAVATKLEQCGYVRWDAEVMARQAQANAKGNQ
jgi:hypothetical protein